MEVTPGRRAAVLRRVEIEQAARAVEEAGGSPVLKPGGPAAAGPGVQERCGPGRSGARP